MTIAPLTDLAALLRRALTRPAAAAPAGPAFSPRADRAGGAQAADARAFTQQTTARDADRGPSTDDLAPATPGWKEGSPPAILAALALPLRWFERVATAADEDGRSRTAERPYRFLAELEGGDGGRLQLDGLLTLKSRGISLIVRSEHPLAATDRQTVAALFTDGVALAGWDGEIAFRAGTASLIDPAPATPPPPCQVVA